jgi:ketosteroid isomerase-like protein
LSPRLSLRTSLLLLLAACTASGEHSRSISADESAIRSARATQNAAIASGDVERAAAFWTEDVELRRGLGQLVEGREAYRQIIVPKGNRDSALVYQREPATVVVSATWPLAYESGKWSGHLGAIDGPAVISGDYSAQWVKRADRWMIRSELFVALTCAGVGCAFTAVP